MRSVAFCRRTTWWMTKEKSDGCFLVPFVVNKLVSQKRKGKKNESSKKKSKIQRNKINKTQPKFTKLMIEGSAAGPKNYGHGVHFSQDAPHASVLTERWARQVPFEFFERKSPPNWTRPSVQWIVKSCRRMIGGIGFISAGTEQLLRGRRLLWNKIKER